MIYYLCGDEYRSIHLNAAMKFFIPENGIINENVMSGPNLHWLVHGVALV